MDQTDPLLAELIEDILILEPSERLDINEICKKLNDAKKDIFQWSAFDYNSPADNAEPTVFLVSKGNDLICFNFQTFLISYLSKTSV